jgi:hypothetical protein
VSRLSIGHTELHCDGERFCHTLSLPGPLENFLGTVPLKATFMHILAMTHRFIRFPVKTMTQRGKITGIEWQACLSGCILQQDNFDKTNKSFAFYTCSKFKSLLWIFF